MPIANITKDQLYALRDKIKHAEVAVQHAIDSPTSRANLATVITALRDLATTRLA